MTGGCIRRRKNEEEEEEEEEVEEVEKEEEERRLTGGHEILLYGGVVCGQGQVTARVKCQLFLPLILVLIPWNVSRDEK